MRGMNQKSYPLTYPQMWANLGNNSPIFRGKVVEYPRISTPKMWIFQNFSAPVDKSASYAHFLTILSTITNLLLSTWLHGN